MKQYYNVISHKILMAKHGSELKNKHTSSFEVSSHEYQDIVNKIIQEGRKYIGVSYKLGSKGKPMNNIDCSGFTQYIFGTLGFLIGDGTANQWNVGTTIGTDLSKCLPGDLIVSKSNGKAGSGHVRMVVSNNNGNITVLESAGDTGVVERKLRTDVLGNYRIQRPFTIVNDSNNVSPQVARLRQNVLKQAGYSFIIPGSRWGRRLQVLWENYLGYSNSDEFNSSRVAGKLALNELQKRMALIIKDPYHANLEELKYNILHGPYTNYILPYVTINRIGNNAWLISNSRLNSKKQFTNFNDVLNEVSAYMTPYIRRALEIDTLRRALGSRDISNSFNIGNSRNFKHGNYYVSINNSGSGFVSTNLDDFAELLHQSTSGTLSQFGNYSYIPDGNKSSVKLLSKSQIELLLASVLQPKVNRSSGTNYSSGTNLESLLDTVYNFNPLVPEPIDDFNRDPIFDPSDHLYNRTFLDGVYANLYSGASDEYRFGGRLISKKFKI